MLSENFVVDVQSLNWVWLLGTPWTAAHRLLCPLRAPGVCSNSSSLSWLCYPTISSSAAPFSSCPQSFPMSGSFPVSRLFASGGQKFEASGSASVLPMNSQGWFSIGLTGLISYLSKGLWRVFSSTTVQKYQFFGIQPSLWSNFSSKYLGENLICVWCKL